MKMISHSKETAIIMMKRPLKESRDNESLYKSLKTGYSMKDNGSEQCVMVSVSKNGPMEPFMMDYGKITKLRERENLYTQMGITTKASGKTIRQMDMEYLYTLKPGLNMKGIGKMICSTDQACRYIATAINTKECLSKVGEMDRVLILIQQERSILEDG